MTIVQDAKQPPARKNFNLSYRFRVKQSINWRAKRANLVACHLRGLRLGRGGSDSNMAAALRSCHSQKRVTGPFGARNAAPLGSASNFAGSASKSHLAVVLDNVWTYIGYFRQHFPNDWSANCSPMDGESPAWRCDGLAVYWCCQLPLPGHGRSGRWGHASRSRRRYSLGDGRNRTLSPTPAPLSASLGAWRTSPKLERCEATTTTRVDAKLGDVIFQEH